MSQKPMILALDIATNTGWAAGRVGQAVPHSGSELICKPSASEGARVGKAMQFLSRMVNRFDPDIVYIEKRISAGAHMASRSGPANTVLGCYDNGIKGMCWILKKNGRFRPLEEVAVSTVRSYFIKAGRLKSDIAKPRVMERCRQLGWIGMHDEDQSYDRSDALAIWAFAENQMAPDLATLGSVQ